MRWAMSWVTLALLSVGCGAAAPGRDVQFSLGKKTTTVDPDSTYGYRIQVSQEILASGRDSAEPYLLVLHVKQGVGLQAGKKPLDEHWTVAINGGRKVLETADYVSKCTAGSTGNCLERYVDPEYSFSLIGFTPVTRLESEK
jgi:hypothetical protein